LVCFSFNKLYIHALLNIVGMTEYRRIYGQQHVKGKAEIHRNFCLGNLMGALDV